MTSYIKHKDGHPAINLYESRVWWVHPGLSGEVFASRLSMRLLRPAGASGYAHSRLREMPNRPDSRAVKEYFGD